MLVIEDGTGVAGATSYASEEQAVTWLTARGLNASGLEPLLLRAMDIIEAQSWGGAPAVSGQALAFPRLEIGLPKAIALAQIRLARHIGDGEDPSAASRPAVQREKVGPIDTTFAVGDSEAGGFSLDKLPGVFALIRPYLATQAAPGAVAVGRINRG